MVSLFKAEGEKITKNNKNLDLAGNFLDADYNEKTGKKIIRIIDEKLNKIDLAPILNNQNYQRFLRSLTLETLKEAGQLENQKLRQKIVEQTEKKHFLPEEKINQILGKAINFKKAIRQKYLSEGIKNFGKEGIKREYLNVLNRKFLQLGIVKKQQRGQLIRLWIQVDQKKLKPEKGKMIYDLITRVDPNEVKEEVRERIVKRMMALERERQINGLKKEIETIKTQELEKKSSYESIFERIKEEEQNQKLIERLTQYRQMIKKQPAYIFNEKLRRKIQKELEEIKEEYGLKYKILNQITRAVMLRIEDRKRAEHYGAKEETQIREAESLLRKKRIIRKKVKNKENSPKEKPRKESWLKRWQGRLSRFFQRS